MRALGLLLLFPPIGHNTRRPGKVSLNGRDVPRFGSRADLDKAENGWSFEPSSALYAKFTGLGRQNTLVIR